MLDKLVDFIISIIKDILPVTFVNQWCMGVILRFGKFQRKVSPGLVWKIPFADILHEVIVVTCTVTVPTQSLTTKDGLQIVTKAVVKYHIDDVILFSLEVYNSRDAILDTAQSIIKELLASKTWEECRDERIDGKIAIKLRAEVKRWGIDIEKVTLTDIGLIKSIRLFNESELIKNSE